MSETKTPPAPSSDENTSDLLRAAVAKQAALVRTLKKAGGDWAPEVVQLKKLREQLALCADSDVGQVFKVDRDRLDIVLRNRMFVVPSFEIYGGTKGFFDFGPTGCALKANLLALWRRHFVLEDSMLEVECTNLMPHAVLNTSGHVERFTDLMVKDPKNDPPCARADKLLEEHIENLLAADTEMSSEERKALEVQARKAEALGVDEMHEAFQKFGIKSPSGNEWSKPFPFNLMFKTTIGPEGTQVGYLRPETAQGIFINFERLRDFNAGKLPFAAAQIGQAYRNEIAPRSGLLRVREFCQAEIEHFVDPENKNHSKFSQVKDLVIPLFDRHGQLESGKMTMDWTMGKAVAEGMIDNETLAYFMSRTYLFLRRAGIHADKIRFRQHLKTEMAHYATDCWDAEILNSYGWTECVGHADRSCFDLDAHANVTGRSMVATKKVAKHTVRYMKIALNRKVIGKTFKKEGSNVVEALEHLAVGGGQDKTTAEESAAGKIEAILASGGEATVTSTKGSWTITRDMCSWKVAEKQVQEVKYRPSVVEPSFGIGRIMYSLLEHAYAVRKEEQSESEEKKKEESNKKTDKKKKNKKGKKDDDMIVRNYFKFNPVIAPIKCAVLPLSNHSSLEELVSKLKTQITRAGISCKVDASGAQIGRRYARMDEIGVPFAVVVDFATVGYETAKDDCVTLRERDTMEQVRVSVNDVADIVFDLCEERTTWDRLVTKFGLVGGSSSKVGKTPIRGGGNVPEETATELVVGAGGFARPKDL
jgi:glycyl-tRNA synthetase